MGLQDQEGRNGGRQRVQGGRTRSYRTTGTMIVEAIGKEYKDTDFKSAAINRINGAANAAGDMAYRVETFRLMFGRVPNMANEEDRNTCFLFR